ncbi:hypothetical protein FsymDg_4291 [Candidatus Protofrankia datiscae]|uniref:Uncharacterized protein n=1 Tax=Candidatus Protofrankia datiscae TaxID=2716812 RepID=F8AYI2_9ACTN|nr:hypothetical protein FsymDg_4291 [Candidatus Protofrankia datiscae]
MANRIMITEPWSRREAGPPGLPDRLPDHPSESGTIALSLIHREAVTATMRDAKRLRRRTPPGSSAASPSRRGRLVRAGERPAGRPTGGQRLIRPKHHVTDIPYVDLFVRLRVQSNSMEECFSPATYGSVLSAARPPCVARRSVRYAPPSAHHGGVAGTGDRPGHAACGAGWTSLWSSGSGSGRCLSAQPRTPAAAWVRHMPQTGFITAGQVTENTVTGRRHSTGTDGGKRHHGQSRGLPDTKRNVFTRTALEVPGGPGHRRFARYRTPREAGPSGPPRAASAAAASDRGQTHRKNMTTPSTTCRWHDAPGPTGPADS